MNRFKLRNSLRDCSKLQLDFHFSGALAGQNSVNTNPNLSTMRLDDDGNSQPIEILYRRYLQLKDAWYEKQPTEFKDIFEVNTYCSEALAYVSKLETMIEGVKTMYREQWYREQYLTMSKHGFHALLAGTHSIFVLYKILKGFFYLVFSVAIGLMGWNYLENGKTLSDSDMEFLAKCFFIYIGIVIMEVLLFAIFGKNHQQIIKDKIRQSNVPDSCYSTHLLTIIKDTKKLRDDIDFFQKQWENNFKN